VNRARRIRARGAVQGVGFRPFVYTHAIRLGITGTVSNDSAGVLIDAEGPSAALAELERLVRDEPPPMAVVVDVVSSEIPLHGHREFHIVASNAAEAGRTFTAPDLATCADCLAELVDPDDRRYRHPFISCTNCGPRFTIVTELPYDRHTTTMVDFAMCDACQAEYSDPGNRRFHAQTIACHDCGPVLEYEDDERIAANGVALAEARAALQAGRILAVKGIGGYHLACDGRNEAAVAELRRRKRRGDKPFAIMVANLDVAATLVHIDETEAATLLGAQRPILLLDRRDDAEIAGSIAPGSPDIGLMLPYTPLHALLFGLPGDPPGPDVLVMTSGNLGGEPIAYDDEDARIRLAGLADGWLRHDRRIAVPCDDSVARRVDGAEVAIRRSRGYAPLPVALPASTTAMLAVGADLKNTCCVAEDRTAWLSQHIGDMDDLATLAAFDRSAHHLGLIAGIDALELACDSHPGYRSSSWALRHQAGRPVAKVQHHHAHVASVMAEHGLSGETPVIGVAFDGTGYGTDGAIWGGEILIADYVGFERFRHLAYVGLAGGDISVDRPYRMALAHLRAAGIEWSEDLPPVAACPPLEQAALAHQLDSGFAAVPTSSIGRLFDAVAALAGVRQTVDFEAQAAMELESLARNMPPGVGYKFGFESPGVFDAAPVIREIVTDLRSSSGCDVIARKFHQGLANAIVHMAEEVRASRSLDVVVLGGGTFQNVVLLKLVTRGLMDAGFTVLTPTRLPANDGGLALGQVMVATANRTVAGN
jgi:hydrogenase maturation protein HypF